MFIDYSKYRQYQHIVGVDEVGRGPLSGPVVACSFLLDKSQELPQGIQDSKKISKKNRTEIAKHLTKKFKYTLGVVSNIKIDEINILNATMQAMKDAVAQLAEGYNLAEIPILIDGRDNPFATTYALSEAIIKGDSKSAAIACASIIAKVYRDNLMEKLAFQFPQYGWERNAGYGTKQHIIAIKEYGITEHHRKSFLKKLVSSC